MSRFKIKLWVPSDINDEVTDYLKQVQSSCDVEFSCDRYKKGKRLSRDDNAIAAVSYHEDFSKFYEDNNLTYGVLAMMGGGLPQGRPFYRWGFSAYTSGYVIGQYVRESYGYKRTKVLVIDCHPTLGKTFYDGICKSYLLNGFEVLSKTGEAIIDKCIISGVSEIKAIIDKEINSAMLIYDKLCVIPFGYGCIYEQFIKALLALENDNIIVVTESNYTNCSGIIEKACFAKKIICVTGRVEKGDGKSVFVHFAEDAISLCNDAVSYIKTLGQGTDDDISRSRELFIKYVSTRKFYSTKYFGSIFFRKDGELFLPLYVYDGNLNSSLEKQLSDLVPYIHTMSTPEVLIEQVSQVSDELQKIRKVDVPRSLSEGFNDKLKNHLQICSNFMMNVIKEKCSQIEYFIKESSSFKCFADIRHDNSGSCFAPECLNSPDTFAAELLDICSENVVLQINLKYEDVENNDTLRIYYVSSDTNEVLHLTRMFHVKREDMANKCTRITCLIIAQSYLEACMIKSCPQFDVNTDKEYINIAVKREGAVLIKRNVPVSRLVEFIASHYRGNGTDNNSSFLYYILNLGKEKESGGIGLITSTKLGLLELQILGAMISRIFSVLYGVFKVLDLELSNTKSAIGSIMSRNGSHNIGSHVLAALSHNVGTLPDDRVLYQYIQHRMDYIATATTEFPTWRQPTMLVSDMMREFLSQTHLLNYISKSEGLRAYQFQNPSIGKQDEQFQTIKFHIRKIHDNCNDWESNSFIGENDKNLVDSFIVYGGTDSATFDKDIAVAIPGGVVGQHAFFTILENIIRNAAKHEWSKLAEKDICNLDVYVDFHDNRNEGIVEMRVWTDCGVQQKDTGETINSLAKKINQSFISPDSGELVRENWGLAEMRISAGFLMGSGIEQIGGISEEKGRACELVWPISIKHKEGKECLGYRFNFMKPKELLVIISDLKDDDVKSINDVLSQFGIELMSKKKSKEALKGLSYSYVLIDHFDFEEDASLLSRLPFRILSPNEVKNSRNIIAKYSGDFYSVSGEETIGKKLGRIQKEFELPNKIKEFAHHLLEDVYASWVVHIRTERNIPLDSKLWVDVDGDGKGAGKSLVTDSDLLHFVFEHSFNSAVRGYLLTVDKKQVRPELAGALYSFVMLDSREIKTVEVLSGLKNINGRELDVVGKIALQLIQFAETCLDNLPNSGERAKVKIDVEKIKADNNTYVHENWKQSLQGVNLLESLLYIYEGCKRIYIEEDVDNAAEFSDVRAFVKYLRDVVLEQARAFLSKYEERIATIPETFVSAKVLANGDDSNGTNSNDVPVYEWKLRDKTILSAVFSSKRLVSMERGFHKDGFCYWRHGDEYGKGNEDSLGVVKYFEPLSGSQSYLNSLVLLQRNVRCLQRDASDNRLSAIRDMTGLVECALMRILIIDERASKFEKEHPEVAWIFKKACITVWDDTADQIKTKDSSGLKFNVFDNFDIVIIHQGIIDKILPNDHSKQSVENFLQKLKEHSRYVVITTGRGMPSNVPATARVLPFSVVENTMFTRYPEKMLLVDTIMNILPREK